MKKLLLLLLLPLLFACSSDKEHEPEIDYIDNSLIEGKWVHVDGSWTRYAIFEDNIWREQTWHTYNHNLLREFFRGDYKLSKTHIYYGNDKKAYTLENDILTYKYDGSIDISYTKVND